MFHACALLVFRLLWPVPFSFAAGKDAGGSEAVERPAAPGASVTISTTLWSKRRARSAPSGPTPIRPLPGAEARRCPDAPIVPEYEGVHGLSADDASSVLAGAVARRDVRDRRVGKRSRSTSVKDVLAGGRRGRRHQARDLRRQGGKRHRAWRTVRGMRSDLREVARTCPPASRMGDARVLRCPKLVELPDEFAFADEAVADECFGFEEPAETLLATVYGGADENVLGMRGISTARACESRCAGAADG